MTARVRGMGSRGAERLALRVEAAQTAGAVPHRMLTVEMAADEDVQAGTGAAAGLLGQLERDEAGGDDVIAPDHALVLDAEDLLKVDAAEGDERRRGVRGQAGEFGGEEGGEEGGRT